MNEKNRKISQAVIFAGGLGERLKPFTNDNPKPMFEINGKPFIVYLINQIKSFGIYDIILLLGYLPDKIIDYLGDGSKFGVKITYCITPVNYDTQLRLKDAKDKLNEDFLLMYCDNYCPINFDLLVDNYFKNDALIELTVYDNSDKYTKDNLIVDNSNSNDYISSLNGIISVYDKKRTKAGLKGVDIGYAIVSKQVFKYMDDENENFEFKVYNKLVDDKKLYATITKHRYYSIGSFERIELTKKFFSNKKYIFIDRDGTLNIRPKKAEYICKPEDFVWLDGAREAIKKLNENDYFVILISNQAGIARGILTINDFNRVQNKMNDDLSEIGAHINAAYVCPHGWDENCDCRKPLPGLIYKAQKDYSINLTDCLFIGDDERDMITANNAFMNGVLVDDEYNLLNAVNDILNNKPRIYEVSK